MNMRDKLNLQIFTAISIVSLGIYPALTMGADAPQGAIKIDVTNDKGQVDYGQVDKFIAAQDKQHPQYFAKEGNDIILSEKPIPVTKLASGYKPGILADLGLKVLAANQVLNSSVVKLSNYRLASNGLYRMPRIPDFVVEEPAQLQAAPSSPVVASTPIATSAPAKLMQVSPATQMKVVVDGMTIFVWSAIGLFALLLSSLILRAQSRRSSTVVKASSYSGPLTDPTDLIGKGELFDFTNDLVNNKAMTINTNYLNMLWKVGKFSKDGAVNTYFYMAYYVPSQHAYASTLQNNKLNEKDRTQEQA
jgi:hypothetical protein